MDYVPNMHTHAHVLYLVVIHYIYKNTHTHSLWNFEILFIRVYSINVERFDAQFNKFHVDDDFRVFDVTFAMVRYDHCILKF